MEQLNIYNYEAFYLDFLDGNLNQEDVAQLFRFLDENPSLKIEEENFDEIINFNERLDDSFKNELKQVDFELDEITQFTINSFLIGFNFSVIINSSSVFIFIGVLLQIVP